MNSNDKNDGFETAVIFLFMPCFFVMGLAIALQSRQHSRLELARALGWLAAFGFAHGLHEWGAIFIPNDGGGFSPNGQMGGYGLHNMRDRACLLGGQLHIQSQPKEGTTITLNLSMEESV